VADGLSTLLHNEVATDGIEPVRVCRNAPGISHLLFADDSLLFFKAQTEQAHRIKEVLDIYASSTGQLINPSKCSIIFGNSCSVEQREEVKSILQVTTEAFETKYLGLPTPEGRMNQGKFQSLQAKLAKCLVEWDDNHKSQAAKEILIKAIAQAIPVYVMSVFKLPFGLCDELTKMIRRYFWGAENGRRKTHWVAWDIMLRPKSYGGVGFRDMRLFNQSLLARQAWRLIQFPDTLCAQLLKAKYYPNGSLIDTVFTGNGSSTWHAIEHGLQLLKTGVIWRVGNGASIRVWRDPWIPREGGNYQPRSNQGRCRYRWVSDFLHQDGTWNIQHLEQYFDQDDITEILKIQTSRRNEPDFLAWQPDKRGMFSVKSAYKMALHSSMMEQDRGATSLRPDGARPEWKIIWNCPVPPKVRVLAWKICRNAISTQLNLKRRGMATSGLCPICRCDDEDSFHVFVKCQHARDLWNAMAEVWDLPPDGMLKNTGPEWLLHLLVSSPENQRAPTLMTLWRIWHAHNEITHDKPCPPIEGSRRFLVSYLNSLLLIKQFPAADITKGKMVINLDQGFKKAGPKIDGRKKVRKRWEKPNRGEAKLNVDGAFTRDGAGTGMVLRDQAGEIIFAACRSLRQCSSATEAEILAIEEGLQLSLFWTPLKITVESDCVEAVELIKEGTPNTSAYAFRINTIRELIRERDVSVLQVSREANMVSHELAKLGRVQARTEFWLRDAPQEIAMAMNLDCNLSPV
jgi:ribonuclease HI